MKIELRNIKHMPSLSEETYCYSAVVYVDGVKTFTVTNAGHGGPDSVYEVKGAKVTEEQVEAYCKTLPPHDVSYMYSDGEKHTLEQSFELLCHDQVTDFLTAKDLKRTLARKYVWQGPEGKIWNVGKPKGNYSAEAIAKWLDRVRTQNGVTKFLNDLPFEQALEIFKKAAA